MINRLKYVEELVNNCIVYMPLQGSYVPIVIVNSVSGVGWKMEDGDVRWEQWTYNVKDSIVTMSSVKSTQDFCKSTKDLKNGKGVVDCKGELVVVD